MADPTFLLKATDYLHLAFTKALRTAFAAQDFVARYKYNTRDTLSKISIYDHFPKRPWKAPSIIVSTGKCDFTRSTLNSQEFLQEYKNPSTDIVEAFYAWGKIDTDVYLNIRGRTDRDCRKLTDLTMLFCRHLFKAKFVKFGIGFDSIIADGEDTTDWQGQLQYTNRIAIPCYTEFQVKYPVELVENINNLDIEITVEV